MGCVKQMIYVKSTSGAVQGKGLEQTGYAQGRAFWVLEEERSKMRLRREVESIPASGSQQTRLPIPVRGGPEGSG
jgi:hypothetical protein